MLVAELVEVEVEEEEEEVVVGEENKPIKDTPLHKTSAASAAPRNRSTPRKDRDLVTPAILPIWTMWRPSQTGAGRGREVT